MQKIEIIMQKFYINPDNISYVLNDLKKLYPQITELVYESDVHNLQLFLNKCGLHTRINLNMSVFTISYMNKKIEYDIDYDKIFECLSTRMSNDSIIVAKIDDNEITYTSYASQMVKILDTQFDEMLIGIDKKIVEDCTNDYENKQLSQLDESEKEGELVEEEEGSTLIEDVVILTEKEELKPAVTLNSKKKGRHKKT